MIRLLTLPLIVFTLFLMEPAQAQEHARMDSIHSKHMEMMQDSTMKKKMMKMCMNMMHDKMKKMHNMHMKTDSTKAGKMMKDEHIDMKMKRDSTMSHKSMKMSKDMSMSKMCMMMCMHMMHNRMQHNGDGNNHHKEEGEH